MADGADRPGYSFNPGPPPEASRYLKNKGFKPAFSWEDVEPEEHAVAFTVAKAMEIDLLEAMRGEVQKALDEGQPLAAFQKSWRANPKLAEWWGRKYMVDPADGVAKEVQLGSPRRLRTIYNANIRSARAAGQWERIDRTKDTFPYLEYRTGPSENHRPHHLDKAGLILPVDDPFWAEWMPPNGWGCKCWVRQVTRAEAARRGISDAPEIRDVKVVNKRTGEEQLVPQGIDPGWQRNPGQLRIQQMDAVLAGKIGALPEQAAITALRDIATSWRVARIMNGAPGSATVGMLSEEMATKAGLTDRLISVNEKTFEHLIAEKIGDPKEVAFRKGLMAVIANVHRSVLAAVEITAEGYKTLRIVIPFEKGFHVAESNKKGKAERPTALVLWFDDEMRVRTIMPTTEKRFAKETQERGDTLIDLKEQ